MRKDKKQLKGGVIDNIFNILMKLVSTPSGKALFGFALLIICLASTASYIQGMQGPMSEDQQKLLIQNQSSSSPTTAKLDLASVEDSKVQELDDINIENMEPAASRDSEKRTEKKESDAVKQSPLAESNASPAELKGKDIRYTLAAGTYILNDNLQKTRRFAGNLSLPLNVKEKTKNVKMTRLLVGTFPVEQKSVELTRLKAYTKNAFIITSGREFSLYAGSYYNSAGAGRAKKRLTDQGLNVKEVSVQVEMPAYSSYIGNFETVEAAMLASNRAEVAGIKMPIVVVR
jgi:hypothetical protein